MKEWPVKQYIRPNGHTRELYAPVSDNDYDFLEKYDYIVSAELIPGPTGSDELVAIYLRRSLEPEEDERLDFAWNGPDQSEETNYKSPDVTLARMIANEKELI